jgi:hypothetical protein
VCCDSCQLVFVVGKGNRGFRKSGGFSFWDCGIGGAGGSEVCDGPS